MEQRERAAAPTDCREKTGMKPVILVVSFGTSYNDSREKTIGAVERAIAQACPNYEVRRAFTSRIIIGVLRERDHLEIDNVEQALERLVKEGVRTLVVQPTHVMSGYEYDEVVAAVESRRGAFDFVSIGAPLLDSGEDYDRVVSALTEETAGYRQEDTAVVFMGHGTGHQANIAYANLQDRFTRLGGRHYLVGTVEAKPSLDDVVSAAKKSGCTRAVLEPLMVVAGDHANNDMAGDGDGSWKTTFQAEGFQVEIVLKGLGEIEAIRQIYVDHVQRAIAALK